MTETLVLKVERTTGTDRACLRIRWLGKANDRRPQTVLAPYFAQLVAAASADQQYIEFHFEGLEYVNSSTVLSIMHLIQSLRRHSIRLVIVYDQGQKWQRLTFDVLRHLDKKDGLLELRGAATE